VIILLKTACAVIVSYNCDEKILEGIDAIKNQVDFIAVIDNGSDAKSIDILKKADCSRMEIIYNSSNMGIAYALNQGIRYAKKMNCNWIVTLDQDSIATKGMINEMFEVYYSFPEQYREKVVSLVPVHIEQRIYDADQKTFNNIKYEEVLTEITSGNLLKTDLFDKIGYFEEKLFIDCVDNEFCLRICKNGYKIIKVNASVLIHNLGDTEMRKFFNKKAYYTNHSFIRRYYITRNRCYIWSLYNDSFPEWVKIDRTAALKDLMTIILFEKDKFLKLKMILKGYFDCKSGNFGKINI
jgi:rhamnosyltransferase